MAEAHEGHDQSPDDDDGGEENARRKELQECIREGLEDGVGDEENRQRHVIVGAGHPKVGFHASKSCISDVGSIEEGEEIEQRQPWDQPQVDLEQEFAVLLEVSVSSAWIEE